MNEILFLNKNKYTCMKSYFWTNLYVSNLISRQMYMYQILFLDSFFMHQILFLDKFIGIKSYF